MMRRVLLTGGTGFIGRHLVSRLAAIGVELHLLGRGGPPADLTPRARWWPVDLTIDVPAEPFIGIDTVIHLAGMVSFRCEDRSRLFAVNVGGTRRVLTAASRAGSRRVVVVSSAITCGAAARPDLLRDESAQPTAAEVAANPYLASKLAVERLVAGAVAQGAPVLLANPTTVYGAGDRTLNSGTLIRMVARAPVFPVPPGGCNVIAVDDVVEGLLAVAARGRIGCRHLLAGSNLRYREVIATVAAITGQRGWGLPLPAAAHRPVVSLVRLAGRAMGGRFLSPAIVGDLFRFRFFDPAWTRRQLSWQPRISLTAAVTAAWRYYRETGLIQ